MRAIAMLLIGGFLVGCSDGGAKSATLLQPAYPQFSTSSALDTFRVYGVSADQDGHIEAMECTYVWDVTVIIEFVYTTADAHEYEPRGYPQDGDCGVYEQTLVSGGHIDVELYQEGVTRYRQVEADIEQQLIEGLQTGSYAIMEAVPYTSENCEFIYWNADGNYITNPIIRHDAFNGTYNYMAIFKCYVDDGGGGGGEDPGAG